MNPDF